MNTATVTGDLANVEVIAEAEAITATAAITVCDDASCRTAYSHRDTCECACGGAGHGIRFRTEGAIGAANFAARAARVGGVYNTIPAAADDEPF